MKQLAVWSVLSLVFALTACGGAEKPPLTPDQDPGLTDAGAEMPGDPAAPPAQPDPAATPAK